MYCQKTMNGDKEFIWAFISKYTCPCFTLRTASLFVICIEFCYAIALEVLTFILLNFVKSYNPETFSVDFEIPIRRAEGVLECKYEIFFNWFIYFI